MDTPELIGGILKPLDQNSTVLPHLVVLAEEVTKLNILHIRDPPVLQDGKGLCYFFKHKLLVVSL